MKDNANGQQSIYAIHDGIMAQAQRAQYSSPILKVYGCVSKMTQGNNSFDTDKKTTQANSQNQGG